MKSGSLSAQMLSKSWETLLKPSQFHVKQENDCSLEESVKELLEESNGLDATEEVSVLSDDISLNGWRVDYQDCHSSQDGQGFL